MQFDLARFSMIALGSLLLGRGCAQVEEVNLRNVDSGQVGTGGDAGSSGDAGSGGAETGGAGGTTTGSGGGGGISGSGGSGGADAGTGKGGSSGATGGRGGSGGATGGSAGSTSGTGGFTGGSGGATGGSAGSTGGVGGSKGGSGGVGGAAGGAGAGGFPDAGSGVDGGTGSCPAGASYCSDFERDTAGTMPVGWTRVGGSDGDWQVTAIDASNVFAQDHATSSTFRLCYPSSAPGGPWSGATTVSARVKILTAGSSGITTALLCIGYRPSSNYGCLALEQGSGARIRMNAGSSSTDGPLWPAAIAVGTWYDVKISMDASGALTAYLGGVLLGSYMPQTAVTGYVAVATQSSQAAFDTVMVTQP